MVREWAPVEMSDHLLSVPPDRGKKINVLPPLLKVRSKWRHK
jgi:hypothetical protein